MSLFNENFLRETEKFNNHRFNKKDDVQRLISIVIDLRKEEVVNKAPVIPEVESIEHVKADISENMKKVIDQLRSILSGSKVNTKNFFEENYLSLNQNSFSNLNLLLADLEAIKKYLNHLKHSQQLY
jgi:hypothetical protein